MAETNSPGMLQLSLMRALWGEVHAQLRQASIEADTKRNIVRLRFEYDGDPEQSVLASCTHAASEVIADFPSPWQLEEQHIAAQAPMPLSQLQYLVYRRAEAQNDA